MHAIACNQNIVHSCVGPVGVGFPAGAGGGPVATEALSRVSGYTPDGRPSARGGMGPDMVVGVPAKRPPSCLWLSRGMRERGFHRVPCARCAGTARCGHSVWDCVAGCAAWPCLSPEAAPRRHRKTRSRCRSGPPDDDREGLTDTLEGRPHVARRWRGDEFRGGRFRDRIADRPRIDPTAGVIERMQTAGLDPSPGRRARQPFCQRPAWERTTGRVAGPGRNHLYFLRYRPIRPIVASEVWKPLPRKRPPSCRVPGQIAWAPNGGRRSPASAHGALPGGTSARAVGSSAAAAPPERASALGTGPAGRRRPSSRPHPPAHRVGGNLSRWFGTHRRAPSPWMSFRFSGNTSLAPRPAVFPGKPKHPPVMAGASRDAIRRRPPPHVQYPRLAMYLGQCSETDDVRHALQPPPGASPCFRKDRTPALSCRQDPSDSPPGRAVR